VKLEKADIFGCSMGGQAALQLAIQEDAIPILARRLPIRGDRRKMNRARGALSVREKGRAHPPAAHNS
jgi:pimeloyl-ACP methyl ester carboxylesterase